jgi:hypothetical protein
MFFRLGFVLLSEILEDFGGGDHAAVQQCQFWRAQKSVHLARRNFGELPYLVFKYLLVINEG